jgi:hypothetical protein
MMKQTTFRLFSKNLNLYKQITVKYQNVNKNLNVDSPLLSVRNEILNPSQKRALFQPFDHNHEKFLYTKLVGLKELKTNQLVKCFDEVPFKIIDTSQLENGKSYEVILEG